MMSKINENEVHRRMELLSQIEPSSEATSHAIKKVRDNLTSGQKSRTFFISSIIKFAAAAVILICAGYIAGRFSATQQVDVEQLRAELETTVRQDLLEEMNQRWQSAFATSCAQIKDELHHQVRRDLAEFATQTLSASRTVTDQRLRKLIQLIDAARMQDLLTVAQALEQNKTQFGNGLTALASRQNELLRTERN